MAFLYEKIDVLRENGYISNIPSYIPTNLNSAFELRPYQKTAFEKSGGCGHFLGLSK